MFVIPGRKPHFFDEFRSSVDPALRDNMVSEVGYTDILGDEAIRKWTEHGYRLLLRYYGHTAPDLYFLEKLARSKPELKGFYVGESGSGGNAMLRGLKLGASHGLFAGNLGAGLGQLAWGVDREMYNLLKTHGSHVLPLPKGQSRST